MHFKAEKQAIKEAQEKAKEAVTLWLDENANNYLKGLMDDTKKKLSDEFKDYQKFVAQLSEKAQQHVADLEGITNKQLNQLTEEDKYKVKERATQAKEKPENQYTFEDWWARLANAYNEGDFGTALFAANQGLELARDDITIARFMIAKAVVLGEDGKSKEEIELIVEAFRKMMHGEPLPEDLDLGDLDALEGVQKFPVRVKCALLAWMTLIDALREASLASPAETGPKVTKTEE